MLLQNVVNVHFFMDSVHRVIKPFYNKVLFLLFNFVFLRWCFFSVELSFESFHFPGL